jgi:hypothetical protein
MISRAEREDDMLRQQDPTPLSSPAPKSPGQGSPGKGPAPTAFSVFKRMHGTRFKPKLTQELTLSQMSEAPMFIILDLSQVRIGGEGQGTGPMTEFFCPGVMYKEAIWVTQLRSPSPGAEPFTLKPELRTLDPAPCTPCRSRSWTLPVRGRLPP